MRIEQSFRDTKNLRLGLQCAPSPSRERWHLLLLIAHLGGFVQRLIGEAAKASKLELNFMATHRQLPHVCHLEQPKRPKPWPIGVRRQVTFAQSIG